jgi:hypothetical protein
VGGGTPAPAPAPVEEEEPATPPVTITPAGDTQEVGAAAQEPTGTEVAPEPTNGGATETPAQPTEGTVPAEGEEIQPGTEGAGETQ